jgi:dipeptidyl aminopeptidase/acylaminoacyl peptidase
VQLTRGDFSDTAPAFGHDGSLLFLSDRPLNGREPETGHERRRQVYALPASGGEPVPLTDEPLGVGAFRCAKQSARLVVLAPRLPGVPVAEQRERRAELDERGPSALRYTDMPVRFWDRWEPMETPHLVVVDEPGVVGRDLTPEADLELRNDVSFDLSGDGRTVAFGKKRRGKDRLLDVGLSLLDIESGEERAFDETEGVAIGDVRFSPDGARLVCTAHEGQEHACGRVRLWTFDSESGARREHLEAWDRWPSAPVFSADGARLYLCADDGGQRPAFSVDLEGDRVERLTSETAGGAHSHVWPLADGGAAGIRTTLLHPPEPFVVEAGGEPRLLAPLSGFSAEQGAAVAEHRSFTTPGDEGAPVQVHLLAPKARTGPVPVLFWIHGGPINQYTDAWHWRWNALLYAAQGYAVVMPNPRGSTGFGQDFVEGIWGNRWGEACYRDLLAVLDHICADGFGASLESALDVELDSGRMAAMGASFGGYMTNLFGGRVGERFRCLITHGSVFHMSAFAATTDFPSYWVRMMGGPFYDEEGAFDRHSPHLGVAGWTRPTLVLHGDKDYRVPVTEALALYESLRARDVEAELVIFPDENHWILKPRNVVSWNEHVGDFLTRHMGPA